MVKFEVKFPEVTNPITKMIQGEYRVVWNCFMVDADSKDTVGYYRSVTMCGIFHGDRFWSANTIKNPKDANRSSTAFRNSFTKALNEYVDYVLDANHIKSLMVRHWAAKLIRDLIWMEFLDKGGNRFIRKQNEF